MADAERLLRRVRVTLVIRITLDPHGALVKGEVIRVPHHSGPEFRTWSQFVEIARQEATRELPGDDLTDPTAP
jgi:predicted deacylase